MKDETSALASWTPEQIVAGRRWVETWKLAGADLEQLRRKEIRELDTYRTIALLCGEADYTSPPVHRGRLPAWWSSNAGS